MATPLERITLTNELLAAVSKIEGAGAVERIKLAARIAELMTKLGANAEAATMPPPKPKSITVWLTEAQLARLQDKIKGFAKRAAKLGVSPVDLVITGNVRNRKLIFEGDGRGGVSGTMRAVDMDAVVFGGQDVRGAIQQQEVTLTGDLPRLNGWSFLAKLEHEAGGNIVKSAPGSGDVPAKYLSAGSLCEHCGATRNRNATFVVRHDDGRMMQVGSTCLQDFTGDKDANYVAQLAEWRSNLWEMIDDFSDADLDADYGEGGSYQAGIELAEFMAHVAMSVRLFGWVSRENAGHDRVSTADSAIYSYMPPKGADTSKIERPTEADKAKAAEAVEWAKSIPDDEALKNSFLNNIRVIARGGYSSLKNAGIAAAIMVAYDKASETRQRLDAPESEWRGTVGKRETFKGLVLEAVHGFETQYGTTFIHRFRAADGAVFVWKAAGTSWGDERGKAFDVTATVKAHGDYKGVKQTEIQRAKGERIITDAERSSVMTEVRSLAASATSADDFGAAIFDLIGQAGKRLGLSEEVAEQIIADDAGFGAGYKKSGKFWGDFNAIEAAYWEKNKGGK